MELKYLKCDRCGTEWEDVNEPRTAPETLTMKMSDCCLGATNAVDICFKHLCRECVHVIGQISYSVERPSEDENRPRMEMTRDG